ncbi:unnamed protein product, partial [Heterosigma akashiwo]
MLDKKPGLRPIGIGEVLQRILAKAVAWVTKGDVTEVCGTDNLAGGLKSGIEGGVHAMRELWADDDTEPVLSREGTTQGDPLAMLMYAVGVLPLVRKLKAGKFCAQTWYADDASAGGKMGQVREWLDALLEDGPKYGYYPEPRKSIAIVKDWRQLERAKQEFQGLGLEFVEASRFLGGFLGKEE